MPAGGRKGCRSGKARPLVRRAPVWWRQIINPSDTAAMAAAALAEQHRNHPRATVLEDAAVVRTPDVVPQAEPQTGKLQLSASGVAKVFRNTRPFQIPDEAPQTATRTEPSAAQSGR